MSNLLKLPKKKKAQFPNRKTLCISNETKNILDRLEELETDIPELMRIALEDYIERNKLGKILDASNG